MPEPEEVTTDAVVHAVRRLREDEGDDRHGPTTARLAEFMGISSQLATARLNELKDAGEVEGETVEGEKRWWIVEESA